METYLANKRHAARYDCSKDIGTSKRSLTDADHRPAHAGHKLRCKSASILFEV